MLLGFADDFDLIGIDRRSVKASFSLKRETKNCTKTKCMVAAGERGRPNCSGAEIVF